MCMIFICPNYYKFNFVPFLYFQTCFLQYLVDFFTKYHSPILRWTYKVVYQYRDIVTLPPCFTHSSTLLFFAASCGEMPSFDYKNAGIFTIFIGDGKSDTDAVKAADQVYAKSDLLEYCLSHNIPVEGFEDFKGLLALWAKHSPAT